MWKQLLHHLRPLLLLLLLVHLGSQILILNTVNFQLQVRQKMTVAFVKYKCDILGKKRGSPTDITLYVCCCHSREKKKCLVCLFFFNEPFCFFPFSSRFHDPFTIMCLNQQKHWLEQKHDVVNNMWQMIWQQKEVSSSFVQRLQLTNAMKWSLLFPHKPLKEQTFKRHVLWSLNIDWQTSLEVTSKFLSLRQKAATPRFEILPDLDISEYLFLSRFFCGNKIYFMSLELFFRQLRQVQEVNNEGTFFYFYAIDSSNYKKNCKPAFSFRHSNVWQTNSIRLFKSKASPSFKVLLEIVKNRQPSPLNSTSSLELKSIKFSKCLKGSYELNCF